MDGLGTSGVEALESEQLKEPLVVGIAAGKSDGDGSAALAAARTPSTWGRDGVAVDNVDLAPGVTPTSIGADARSESNSRTPRGTCGRSSPALLPTRVGRAATTETGNSLAADLPPA